MSEKIEKISGFGIGEAGSVPSSTAYDEMVAEQSQQMNLSHMVVCDCGHTVPMRLVMRASVGTSCPDCYDEMSD